MKIEFGKANRHFERILLNAPSTSKMITNDEPSVGEPSGLRIIHNLDPNNLSGHGSKKSADVCKALLERTKRELFTNLMALFKSDEEFSLFNQKHQFQKVFSYRSRSRY